MEEQSFAVVLTATVTPSTGASVLRKDPDLRRRDYLAGLRFWLSHPDPRLTRIVFLENSREDLSWLESIALRENLCGKKFEFIPTEPSIIPSGLSYGWGELRMLDEGLERSRLVKESSHIIKATGRLTFPDISRLLDRTPIDCDAMVECRLTTAAYRKGLMFIPAQLTRKTAYATTQLAILSRDFYERYMRGVYQSMSANDGKSHFENMLYAQLRRAEGTQKVSFRFPVNCEPHGFGGYDVDYNSARRRVTRTCRAALRWTGLWF